MVSCHVHTRSRAGIPRTCLKRSQMRPNAPHERREHSRLSLAVYGARVRSMRLLGTTFALFWRGYAGLVASYNMPTAFLPDEDACYCIGTTIASILILPY